MTFAFQMYEAIYIPPAILTVIFGLPWFLASKASGLSDVFIASHLDSSQTVASASAATFFGDKLCFKFDGKLYCFMLWAYPIAILKYGGRHRK